MTEEKITPNFPSGHDFKKAKEGTSAEEEKLQNLRDHVKESLNRLGYQKDFEPIGGMSDSIERLVGMSLDKGALLERTQFIDGLLEKLPALLPERKDETVPPPLPVHYVEALNKLLDQHLDSDSTEINEDLGQVA